MLRKFDEDDLKRAGDVLTAGAAGK
jgi:hypothetical protein